MPILDDLLYSLAPIMTPDLQTLCEAISAMWAEVEQYSLDRLDEDGNELTGYGVVFDVDLCPVEALPYLAQFVGEILPTTATEAEARRQIRTRPNGKRGTPAGIIAAARATLSNPDTDSVVLRERDAAACPTDPAYGLTIVTFTSQTPNPAATEAAIRANLPAGIILVYTTLPGWDITSFEAAGYANITAFEAAFGSSTSSRSTLSSTSTHLALVKPVGADAVSTFRTAIGSNADLVDTAMGRVMAGLQEGVIDAGSCMVTQDTGSNMNVKAATNVGSGSYVTDDGVTGQALYYVAPTGSATTVAIGTAHATLPRVDRVVQGLDGTISVVAGTATSGATLNNLTGATGVPASKSLLADVLVGAAVTAITNSVIRDRRKWARGAHRRMILNSYGGAGTGPSATNTNLAFIDATWVARIECSGVPLKVSLLATIDCAPASAASLYFSPQIDSVGPDGMTSIGASPNGTGGAMAVSFGPSASGGYRKLVQITYELLPAAGSHVIGWGWAGSGGDTMTMYANSVRPAIALVEEIVSQDAANNTTTTG